jgi:hypothetical protein
LFNPSRGFRPVESRTRRQRPGSHAACGTIDNLSTTALDINSDAIAFAMLSYASGLAVLN